MFDPETLMNTRRAMNRRRHAGEAPRPSRRQGERGMAMIVVITLISLVLMYVAANLRSIQKLGRGLDRIEKRQIKRLEMAGGGSSTNAPPQRQMPILKLESPPNVPKE